ncbi:MAG: hypothetical protein L3J03_00915 [Desulfobacterales bacterium]|nr:hypothetical protein [Desulfobacterales bacterium]
MMDCKKISWGGVLGSIFLLAAGPDPTLAASNQIKINNRTELISYSISGPGKAASFYVEGGHYLHETDIRARNSFDNGWDSILNFNFRLTDNDQFDPENASIEKLSLKLVKDKVQLNLGDHFINLSQYSMNKSVKGLGAQLNLRDKENYIRVGYGIFDSQWEYLYKTPTGEPMDRFGGGIRFQHARDNYRVGLNLGYVRDDDGDPNRTTENAYINTVPALDWEYRRDRLRLSGEHAYSNTTMTTSGGARTETTGTAHRLGLKTRLGVVKLRGRFERVSTDFTTLGGGATPDRQRIYTKADAKLNNRWSVFGMFDHSRNNLADNLALTTTTNVTGEVGVKRKRAFNRRSLKISLSTRRKWTDTDDNSRESTSDRIKLAVSDRLAKVLRVNADIEKIIDNDTTAGGASSSNYFYNLSLSSRHRFKDGRLELRPRFVAGLQERDNLTTNGSDYTTTLRFNLGGTYEKFLRFGLNAERVVNDLSTLGNDSTRTKLSVYCELRPDWLKKGSIRMEGTRNNFDFDDKTKEYREDIVKIMFRYSFEKREG